MKTTLDLPDELVREVKVRAVVQGRTVKDLVTELLSQGLGLSSRGQGDRPASTAMVKAGEQGLPVIRCDPKAPATRMRVKDLLKLEQETQSEEDLLRARHSH